MIRYEFKRVDDYILIYTSGKIKKPILMLDRVEVEKLINIFPSKGLLIPTSIFIKKLGMLESICLYLRDEMGLSFKEIGNLLGKRNHKTIYTSYRRAKEKK